MACTKIFYVIEDQSIGIKKIYEVMPMIQVLAVGVEKMGTGESHLAQRKNPLFFATQEAYDDYLVQCGDNVVEKIEKEVL